MHRSITFAMHVIVQVNHLSQFVLLNALVPLLERNALSRIITVGSMLHTV